MLHYIDELSADDLRGKHVLLRLDLSVPVANGELSSTYQIDKIIETIDFLRLRKAKTIIISHTEDTGDRSLLPMWKYLNGFYPVDFSPTYFTPEAIDKVLKMEDGGVLLFENVRNNHGEKENSPDFAKKLAQMADIYVNDAFSVSHRKHASIVGVPEFLPHYAGFLLRREIEHLSKAFSPNRPFVFILAGAKFDTKLPLIKKYLGTADSVFVGGALASDLFKEKGYEVGKSTVTENFAVDGILDNEKLHLPEDVTVTSPAGVEFKSPDMVSPEECIVDSGPKTLDNIRELVKDAKTIIWNGPLGSYETGFADKTETLAEILAEATERGAETIVGGGDTLAVIAKLDLNEKFTFLSTGGGAMLSFLADETLPGIDALK